MTWMSHSSVSSRKMRPGRRSRPAGAEVVVVLVLGWVGFLAREMTHQYSTPRQLDRPVVRRPHPPPLALILSALDAFGQQRPQRSCEDTGPVRSRLRPVLGTAYFLLPQLDGRRTGGGGR